MWQKAMLTSKRTINTNNMIIKVCGLRDSENIRQVSELGIDWIGMIFWPKSPRYVTMVPSGAGIMPDWAPDVQSDVNSQNGQNDKNSQVSQNVLDTQNRRPKRVGVFVDAMPQDIITHVVNFRLDLVQLHGHESPTLIQNLKATLSDIRPVSIIKAISISCRQDVTAYKEYTDCVDYFLFDTKCKTVGGSGEQFDWSVLDAYDGDKPFLLSGGIGPDDGPRLRSFSHPRCIGIDLNSRFETEPAVKDTSKLQQLLNSIR